jgi:hypothetical protein
MAKEKRILRFTSKMCKNVLELHYFIQMEWTLDILDVITFTMDKL